MRGSWWPVAAKATAEPPPPTSTTPSTASAALLCTTARTFDSISTFSLDAHGARYSSPKRLPDDRETRAQSCVPERRAWEFTVGVAASGRGVMGTHDLFGLSLLTSDMCRCAGTCRCLAASREVTGEDDGRAA